MINPTEIFAAVIGATAAVVIIVAFLHRALVNAGWYGPSGHD